MADGMAGPLVLLTHNAYWFQGHPSRWGAERVAEAPEVFEALMDLYAAAAPDLVCLQEVHRPDLAEAAARRLGFPCWRHAAGGLRPQYGGAVLGGAGCEVADLTRDAACLPCDRIHMRARVPWSGGTLELAAVHLPSNRYAGSREAGEAARVAELERILETAPRPDVVLGDMNSLPGSAPCRLMETRGYVDAAEEGGKDPGEGRRIDYIWLAPRVAKRLVRFETVAQEPFIRTDAQGQPWRLSDHPPLVAELR